MSERIIISFPATFDSANRKKDRSLTLRTTTSLEVNNEDFATADKYVGSLGRWYFVIGGELDPADIPDEPVPTREGKPKGQRLRAVRFLIWKKRGIEEPFEIWYERWFEQLMDKQKEYLD